MKQTLPTLEKEEKLWKKGFDFIVGVDEVGRGPLAGPVVAAACFLDLSDPAFKEEIMQKGIKDSKKVSPKKRKEIFEFLVQSKMVKYAFSVIDEKIIDQINVLQASLLAMKTSVEKLDLTKIDRSFILVDGRDIIPDISFNQQAVIGGDSKVFSIATASIIAKVIRDDLMEEYAEKYPRYGFEKHKGYGTKIHFEALRKYGPCEIHRRSFLHL